jgi:hypothetical protein
MALLPQKFLMGLLVLAVAATEAARAESAESGGDAPPAASTRLTQTSPQLPASAVVDLAESGPVSEVSLELKSAKGRLVLAGLGHPGAEAELATALHSPLLIADVRLTGVERALSFELSKVTLGAVALFWVAEVPGTPLTLSRIAIRNPDGGLRTATKRAPAAAQSAQSAQSPELAQPDSRPVSF